MIYKDRQDAARKLILLLKEYKNRTDAIVIALPRGGIILADIIAQELNLSLDLVIPRKIGAPVSEEFAIGAISEEGQKLLHEDVIQDYKISEKYINKTVEKELNEIKRRKNLYRNNRKDLDLTSQTVLLVDDGIATGATMMAGIVSVREKNAKEIVVVVPFLPPETLERISGQVDAVKYLETPRHLMAVGAFYENFPQVKDEEVIQIMQKYNNS